MKINKDYKIGNPFVAQYETPPVTQDLQYKVGQLVDILDDDKKLLARFEVEETNENEVKGKIVVTHGHKRRKENK